MFKTNRNLNVDRPIKCDYICHTKLSSATIDEIISQVFDETTREYRVISRREKFRKKP